MWYFTWILGIGVALAFGLVNALWLEAAEKFENGQDASYPDRGETRP